MAQHGIGWALWSLATQTVPWFRDKVSEYLQPTHTFTNTSQRQSQPPEETFSQKPGMFHVPATILLSAFTVLPTVAKNYYYTSANTKQQMFLHMTNPLPLALLEVHILSHATEPGLDSHISCCKGYRRNKGPHLPLSLTLLSKPNWLLLDGDGGTFCTFPYGEQILCIERACEVIFQLNLLSVTSGILNNQLSEL